MIHGKCILHVGRAALILSTLSPFLMVGCTTARIPVAGLEVRVPNIPLPAVLRGENDLRGRTWTTAFQILHERLVREYAYSEYKGLDWPSLYTRMAEEVRLAEESKDKEAWYRALRSYVHAIPDGNVMIDVEEMLRVADVGASAGLSLTQLADGAVIVTGLLEDSPAVTAGIEWGATLLSWDGKPLAEALTTANVLWADNPASTTTMTRLQQLAWLPRGPEGSIHEVSFMNPGSTSPETKRLTLVADDFATLPLSRPLWSPVELFSSPVTHRSLDGGYDYIRVAAIAPTFSTPYPARDFKTAVRQAVNSEAPGLIIDLRGTQGGDRTIVPALLAVLVSEETFLETPSSWDSELQKYLVDSEDTIIIAPTDVVYGGPVVVLVDAYTMGPAETMAGFLALQENVRIFGSAETSASPGVPNVDLTLPGGYMVMYPTRRSLDEARNIQGVSDASGVGGVQPDTVFTMDQSSATALFQQGTDTVLEKAVEMLDSATWRFP